MSVALLGSAANATEHSDSICALLEAAHVKPWSRELRTRRAGSVR